MVVNPNFALEKAEKVLAVIARRTPALLVGTPNAGPVIEKVKKFIEKEIMGMRAPINPTYRKAQIDAGYGDPGATLTQGQTLHQIDGMLEKIDQELASFAPGQKKFAIKMLNSVRTALQKDMTTNIYGKDALQVGKDLRALDIEYSRTWQQLFETSTAKRTAAGQKRGIGGFAVDDTTRLNVDRIGDKIIDYESPQSMIELHRLVGTKTMTRIAANAMDTAMDNVLKEGVDGYIKLNSRTMKKYFGIGKSNSPRYKATEKMLELSGNPLKMKDLGTFSDILRKMEHLEIPNASTFLSRRAGIAGIRGVIYGILPGMAIAGGAPGIISGTFGLMLFYGGAKLYAAAISNPLSARALKHVLTEEMTALGVRRQMAGAIRTGMTVMLGDGTMTQTVFNKLFPTVEPMIENYANQMEEDFGPEWFITKTKKTAKKIGLGEKFLMGAVDTTKKSEDEQAVEEVEGALP